MGDDDPLFVDSADEAQLPPGGRRPVRPPPARPGRPGRRPGPPGRPPGPPEAAFKTRRFPAIRPRPQPELPGQPRRERLPPPPSQTARPHFLVSPVLAEPLLLSRARPCTIGRGEDVDVRIKSDRVSRRHAEIAWSQQGFRLRDLGSTNGTLLGGVPVSGAVWLHDGDLIDCGGFELRVRAREPSELDDDAEGPTRALRRPPR